MLMLVALAALLVVFWQSERPGARESTIGSTAFSPDGSRLAVFRLTARRVEPLGMRTVTLTSEHADPTRDIVTIETGSGSIERTLLRESKVGDSGVMMWWHWHFFRPVPQIAFSPKTQKLTAISFVDNHVVYLDVDSSKSRKLTLGHPVRFFAFSKTGKWIGCYGNQLLTVFDATTLRQVRQVKASVGNLVPDALLNARVAFSDDEDRVFFACEDQLESWEILASSAPTQIRFNADPERPVTHVEVSSEGLFFYCSTESIVATGAEGEIRMELVGLQDSRRFSFSKNCKRLVFLEDATVSACEIGDEIQKVDLPKLRGGNVCISPDGKHFAALTGGSHVALFDFETGRQIWEVELPGRGYVTWYWPVAGIVLWSFLAIGMTVRSRRSMKQKADPAA